MVQISVIIPVKDDAARLQQCIDALAMQTLPHDAFEIIIIDDHSQVLPKLRTPASLNVHIYSATSVGPAAARNTGVEYAKAPYIAFTDADCKPQRQWLASLLDVIQPLGTLAMVGGKMSVFFRVDRPTWMEQYFSIIYFRDEYFLERYHFFVTANVCIHRTVWETIGPFNAVAFPYPSAEDREWGERAHRFGVTMQYAPTAVVLHPARTSPIDYLYRFMQIVRGTWYGYVTGLIPRSAAPSRPRFFLFWRYRVQFVYTHPIWQSYTHRLYAAVFVLVECALEHIVTIDYRLQYAWKRSIKQS